jgi:hypothetical protein
MDSTELRYERHLNDPESMCGARAWQIYHGWRDAGLCMLPGECIGPFTGYPPMLSYY